MKIFKWNIDKERSHFSYHIEKAATIKEITYTTYAGQVVAVKAADVRKSTKKPTRFGRVVTVMDLK